MKKWIAKASKDQVIVWFMLIIGTIKMFNLDAYLPVPESQDALIELAKYGSREAYDVAQEIRTIVEKEAGNDSIFSFLSLLGGIAYVIGRKAKEWKEIMVTNPGE